MAHKAQVVAKQRGHGHVGARLARHELETLDALVETGQFLNRSDAVRSAVRQMIGEIRIVNVKNVTLSQAKNDIRSYFKTHKTAYPSDIADDLELEYDLVVKALKELQRSGEARLA